MKGSDIQFLLHKYRIYQYELAAEVGVSEFTLSRWLRDVIPSEHEEKILKAINKIREKDE